MRSGLSASIPLAALGLSKDSMDFAGGTGIFFGWGVQSGKVWAAGAQAIPSLIRLALTSTKELDRW